MSTEPRVSVITPCYNSARFVGAAIESVLRQSFQAWEHVVVDDGSTDDSREVIARYSGRDSRIKLLAQPHGGVCRARNAGRRASSKESEYLLFLDADDLLEPEMLECLARYLDERPSVGLARCEYQFIDAQGRIIDYPEKKARYVPSRFWVRQLPANEPDTPFVSVFTLCVIIPSIALVRRSVFEQTPGFDENFGHHHEDIDLFLHMALRSRIHFVPRRLVRRRRHSAQNTAATEEFRHKARRQLEKLYAKWLGGEFLSEEERKIVRAAWNFKEGRFEPYLAFLRGNRCMKKGDYWSAFRCYFGGTRHYLRSFIPSRPPAGRMI